MGTLAQRLKQLRLELGLSQSALAKRAGLTQGAIGQIEIGRNEGSRHIIQIAAALSVNPSWLATGNGKKEMHTNPLESANVLPIIKTTTGRVPIISLVAAGNWEVAVDNFAPGCADEWANTTVQVRQHTYALRVSGDSMEPKFPSGAIIIVEPEEVANNGSYVIVRQNDSEATFKQLVIDGGNKYLKPLNERYPIMQMMPDAVICGVVKQMVMDV